MSENMVEIVNLSKIYHKRKIEVTALKDVSLEVPRGRVVSIMGTSGSGKTTLLNIIGGIDRPTGGQVRVDGFELTRLGESELATFRLEKVGFVFQFYNLFPMLTAFENVEFPLVLVKKPKLEREKRVWDLLDLVGMRNRAVHRPDELSGGEQQSVGIARALANKPGLVLADEPTGDLDSENANTFMQLVRQLNQTYGQTFLIVTHDPIVSQQCDTIYHIRDGKISKQL
jgi:putative ABC transport system ATP-binding protein